MKILFFIAGLAVSICGYGQTGKLASAKKDTPPELITGDSIAWTLSTVSNVGYVNTTPGANYNTYKSGGGMLIKFRFRKNNRFEFQLYVQANTYGTDTEAWTQVEGTVEFTKDSKGQDIFLTHAEKGTYRTVKNGKTSSRPIPEADLKGQHSGKFLWEKTTFANDPKHIYLLTVDLEKHPDVDLSNPSSIDASWVSRFHIPAR